MYIGIGLPIESNAIALDWAAICAMPQMVGYWDPASGVVTTSGDSPPLAAGNPVGYYPDLSGKAKHATQSTTANKPILRQTPVTQKYWLDADSTDALNITLAVQLTNAAIFRVTAEGVTVARTQTVGTTYNIITPYAYNGPVAIFDESSTALTTNQVAQITRFMQAGVPTLGAEEVPDGTFSTGSTTGWIGTGYTALSVAAGKLNVLKSLFDGGWATARLSAVLQPDSPYLFKFIGSDGSYNQGYWRVRSDSTSAQKGAETFSAGNYSKVAISYPAGSPCNFDLGSASGTVNNSFNYDNVSVRAIL